MTAVPAPLFSIIVPVLGEPPAVMRACQARLRALLAQTNAEVIVVDGDPAGGSVQWLTGVYRTAALRAAAQALELHGASMRALLGPLDLARVPAPARMAADVDTWDDLSAARAAALEE